ncbi:unnamed protein product [Adineta steineri]|uniref:Peptidase M14 domain-containing protein n=1 Tax=Adineta steineri TaxID=433720 RepID=A0A814QDN8_9BILA|nr:unnamed protein product [Adineta steineri]
MNRLFSFVFTFACLAIWSINSERAYVHDKLVRLEPFTDEHIHYLQALEETTSLDFWTEIMAPNRSVDVRIRANEYDQYVSQFKQYSLPYEIIVNDIQEVIDNEEKELAQDRLMRQIQSRWLGEAEPRIVGTYATYKQMETYLDEKAAADPTHIKVIDIGKTYEGRSIKVISIKMNPASTRNIWIDCGIHAREWITPATCIWSIEEFINEYNNRDPIIRQILDKWTVYVAPSLNPDGYEYSQTSGNRLWRKNRFPTNALCNGVDLNRNYPWKWNTGGASTSACSETYCGRSAGSEIETQNVVKFLESLKGTWDMYMSFHAYGQWWFTPYGYTTGLPKDYQKQLATAQAGANALTAVRGTKYAVGSISGLLYIASGSTCDWAYDSLGIKHSYTIELPPTQQQSNIGFVLPVSEAPAVCRETYVGMKEFLNKVHEDTAQ